MQASAARWLAQWARPRAVEALPVRLDRRRVYVLPEDVQALFAAVAAHRLVPEAEAASASVLAKAILHAVPVD